MNYVVSDTSLTSIANSIRSKTGGTGQLLFPGGFTSNINNLITLNDLYLTTVTETVTGNFSFTAKTVKQTSPYTFGEMTLVTTKTPLKSNNGTKNASLITVGTPTATNLTVSGGAIELVGLIPTYAFTGDYITVQVKAIWKSGSPIISGTNTIITVPVTYTIPR